jgi:hypothetical protein
MGSTLLYPLFSNLGLDLGGWQALFRLTFVLG